MGEVIGPRIRGRGTARQGWGGWRWVGGAGQSSGPESLNAMEKKKKPEQAASMSSMGFILKTGDNDRPEGLQDRPPSL